MKGKRPRRKVVLILVEGKSEINALKTVLSSLYDRLDKDIEVFFPTMVEDGENCGGDITSRFGINPEVIEKCIYKLFLSSFFESEKLYPKDVSEIIQIVDLDGAYIKDENVKYGENPTGENKPYYGDEAIITTNVDNIVERNKRKRKNLDYLSSISELHVKQKKPKYSIYFFSSNLDHFLHENANLSAKDKVKKADEFSMKYTDNPDDVVSVIKRMPGSLIDMTYEQSWDYIKTDKHSLEKHTNINLLLDKLLSKTDM